MQEAKTEAGIQSPHWWVVSWIPAAACPGEGQGRNDKKYGLIPLSKCHSSLTPFN